MSAWPLWAFWAIVLAGLRGPPHALFYALFGLIPFASLAVVPPELTGGLTLTPAPVVALLIVLRCLWSAEGRRWVMAACTSPGLFAPLFVFWVVAAFTTLFAPLFFAGEVEIIPMRADDLSRTALLAPSAQQISQLGYLSVSVFSVIACARALQHPRARQHVLRAMALGACALCVTGLLDWLAATVDLEAALAPLRTASYAIATDSRIGNLDMKRVSGVTPEPSVFGSLCVTYLATLWFFRRAMRDAWLRAAVPVLCALLALMIFLSTSTTAYVGFVLFAAIVVAESWWRLIASRRRSAARRAAWSHNRRLALIAAIIAVAFVTFPIASASLAEAFDTIVLQKTESQSFDERSMWTAVSLQSAVDTHGFGVGLGGTRASNSFVAMLSNVGLLGTMLYVAFLSATYLLRPSRRAPDGGQWITAYRWSVPPIIALGLMSGTSADFGPYLAMLFGSTVALQQGAGVERLLQRADRRTARADGRSGRRRRVGRWAGDYALPRRSGREARLARVPAPAAPGTRGALGGGARWLVNFVAVPAPLLDLGDADGERPPRAFVPDAPADPPRRTPRFTCAAAPMLELD